MKKIKHLILVLISLLFICTACGEDPSSGSSEKELYDITVSEVKNGVITPNLSEATEGQEIQLEVAANIGYKLQPNSLKANESLIEENKFIMPAEDVVISAAFDLDAVPYEPKSTNLEISAISNNITATAHFSIEFKAEEINLTVCVEDEKLISNSTYADSDSLSIMFGKHSSLKGYTANSTLKFDINVDGSNQLLVFDGSTFVPKNTNYTASLNYFSQNNKLGGYIVELNLPYSALDLTAENAKNNLSICPVLYNQNSNSSLISASKAVNEEFNCNPENQNTYIYVTDDNTYEINPYAYETYQLGFLDDKTNEHWDLSKDYFPSNNNYNNRVVKLTGTNNNGNHLVFYKTNATELYAEADFLLTNVYAGEQLGKFGFRMVDEYGNGFMFFIDAYGANVSSMTTNREAGYVLIRGNNYDWGTHVTLAASYVPSKNETIKLAVYRNGKEFKLYLNDYLVAVLNDPSFVGATEGIFPTIASFNLGIEVSNYLSTDDEAVFKDLLPKDTTGGYIFKNASDTLRNGVYWDLTNDTEQSSGVVSLNGHDGVDNNLFFNMSSTEFMYARATMELTDYFNKGDAWLKFGLALFDGSYSASCSQYMFYADAYTGDKNYSSSLFHIIGDKFGRALNFNNWTSYDGSANRFNLTTLKVKMELVYENNKLYFYADGALVGVEEYVPKTTNLYIGIKNFGFGLDVTDYYCSTDKSDTKISDYIITNETKALYYFLGSSVTYGSATNGVSFVDLLPKSLDCSVIKNAVSGTTLVDNGSSSYVQRLRQFPKNSTVEHLVVQLSTNDASQNKALGTVSTNGTTTYDTSTIIGAIEDIISYAKSTWNCDVTFYTNPYYNNEKYETMIDALYEIQEKWNIGIIDFYNYKDMTALDSATLSSYMSDAIHPNTKGYEWMTAEFTKYLRAAYEANHPGDSL